MAIIIVHEMRQSKISTAYILLKRCMDIFITLLLLPVVMPLLAIIFPVIYLTSVGPVIFKQQRVGLHGKEFTIYKIRTMIYNEKGYTDYTVQNDKRITVVGILLRKLKLDELPQLLNVIKGEMSLVGPRPERVDIVKNCIRQNDFYHFRHQVKPGMTGWAQVNKPTATPRENFQKLSYDLYYIYNFSIILEMEILIRTMGIVLSMKSL
jgi:lipopolysaccharide/colanic/teichoic acid biosynthesis glycosyltransferase